MKKRMYLFIALFAGASGLHAQDCATGYCPSTILVHHKAGDLSPIGADITYNVVKVGTLCWIAQNLGASAAPTAFNNYGGNYDGWVYQAGLKKGYVPTSNAMVNFSSWPSTWPSSTDPCTQTFGAVWRLPTSSEWTSSYNATWSATPQPNLSTALYYNNNGTILNFTSAATASYQWVSDLGSGAGPIRGQTATGSYGPFMTAASGGTTITVAMSVRCVKKVTD
jgi:hypothetical protein